MCVVRSVDTKAIGLNSIHTARVFAWRQKFPIISRELASKQMQLASDCWVRLADVAHRPPIPSQFNTTPKEACITSQLQPRLESVVDLAFCIFPNEIVLLLVICLGCSADLFANSASEIEKGGGRTNREGGSRSNRWNRGKFEWKNGVT